MTKTSSSDYNDRYYKYVLAGGRESGVSLGYYKQASKGKRYEKSGVVVYIDKRDIRKRKNLTCTEEITGRRFPYSLLFTEDGIKRVREEIEKYAPVASLREVAYDQSGQIVFVEEGEQK